VDTAGPTTASKGVDSTGADLADVHVRVRREVLFVRHDVVSGASDDRRGQSGSCQKICLPSCTPTDWSSLR
jgi:hypothetical protein